jgi:hypothetical protein
MPINDRKYKNIGVVEIIVSQIFVLAFQEKFQFDRAESMSFI